jgi:eukaryotic-like serine/threonine-protein kinase
MTPWSAGTRVGPYEILAPIGAGGMGEVWKARDTRLDRIVAVKRLTGEHDSRFQQEARAIASLNHPHICQIHDVGQDYLVLEYVEGEPLRGPMAIAQALAIAIQIADGVGAAHAKGILHRDIKPANILMSADGPKLVDFGLAKITSEIDATTMAGSGTPLYMSPEQAEGKPLDGRSDIFSFGAVLYEMLAGRRAFDTLGSVLRDDPVPLDCRAEVARIVMRCLAKTAADRFQSMADLRHALQRCTSKTADVQPSIAVLPFANISRNADDEYFSDGLAEEILNALAQIRGLKVIARTSSFAFRGKEQDIRGVAQALGVQTVLEGSVRRSGNRIRVTAQLIEAEGGSHLWSERYDRELTDVFAMQDEIAGAIANQLKVTLTGRSAEEQKPRNLAAYEAYLEGHHHWLKFLPMGFTKSEECFRRAIAADPNYAIAWSGLAGYYIAISVFGLANPAVALPEARSAARRALELDPNLGDALCWAAHVELYVDHDWAASERSFRRGIELSPAPAAIPSCHYAIWVLIPQGRWAEAEAVFDRVIPLDPLYFAARFGKAFALACQGRMDEAVPVLEKALEVEPSHNLMQRWTALFLARQGRFEEAFATMGRALETHGSSERNLSTLGVLYAMAGKYEQARGVINQLLASEPSVYVPAERIATLYALVGDLDRAFEWADKSVLQHDPPLLWIKHHFVFDPLRSDPRYPQLLRKLNLS